MQLKLDSNDDRLMMFVMTGPMEAYEPTEEIKKLFLEVTEVDTKLKAVKELYLKVNEKVAEINKIEAEKLQKTE